MPKHLRAFFYAVLLSLLISTTAFAAPKIIFNGNVVKADVPPRVEKGVTLVPLRVILETLGAQVNYASSTQKITVHKDDLDILLQVGSLNAKLNNKSATLLAPPRIYNSRTLVPLRFISEALKADVNWNAKDQSVTISYHPDSSTGSQQSVAQVQAYEKAIFNLVNATRKEFGLKELIWVDELSAVSRSHSKDMAEHNFFNHISPNTGSPSDRSHTAGLPGVGENIAAGPFTPQTVFEAWMNSPGHRENILKPEYRFTGVGVFFSAKADDNYGGKYFTQNFIGGDTFLTAPYDNITVASSKITVSGYSVADNPKITIYKMVDVNQFSDSYDVPLNVINGKFSQTVELRFGTGTYKIWASGYDVRQVTLK